MNLHPVSDEEGSERIGEYNNRRALPGYVWVCGACGKRSRDIYGLEPVSRGWDESCMLNAVLVKEEAE